MPRTLKDTPTHRAMRANTERYAEAARSVHLPEPLIPGRVPQNPEHRALLESHPCAKQLNGVSIFDPRNDAPPLVGANTAADRIYNQSITAYARNLAKDRAAERRRLVVTTWAEPGVLTPRQLELSQRPTPAPPPLSPTKQQARAQQAAMGQQAFDRARAQQQAGKAHAAALQARTAQQRAQRRGGAKSMPSGPAPVLGG